MRWCELFEDDREMPDTKPALPAKPKTTPVAPQQPIIGVPAEEVEAWIESWDTDHELPQPKARRLA